MGGDVSKVPDKNSRREFEAWTVTDVCTWLTDIGQRRYHEPFISLSIDGRALSLLEENDLIEDFNINVRVHRATILKELDKLKDGKLIKEVPIAERGRVMKSQSMKQEERKWREQEERKWKEQEEESEEESSENPEGMDEGSEKSDSEEPEPTRYKKSRTLVWKKEENGMETKTLKNGDSYTGFFNEYGEFHGKGTYTWADKRVYEGKWANNKREGKGRFRWPDGRTYIGNYKNNLKHGKGEFKFPDRSMYIGLWKYGIQHGKGIVKSAGGIERRAAWDNGQIISWD